MTEIFKAFTFAADVENSDVLVIATLKSISHVWPSQDFIN